MSYHSIECCENLDKKLQNSVTKNWESWGKIAFTQSTGFCEEPSLKMQLNSNTTASHHPKVDDGRWWFVRSKYTGGRGGGICIFLCDICIPAEKKNAKSSLTSPGHEGRKAIDRIVSRRRQDWSPPKMLLRPKLTSVSPVSTHDLIYLIWNERLLAC